MASNNATVDDLDDLDVQEILRFLGVKNSSEEYSEDFSQLRKRLEDKSVLTSVGVGVGLCCLVIILIIIFLIVKRYNCAYSPGRNLKHTFKLFKLKSPIPLSNKYEVRDKSNSGSHRKARCNSLVLKEMKTTESKLASGNQTTGTPFKEAKIPEETQTPKRDSPRSGFMKGRGRRRSSVGPHRLDPDSQVHLGLNSQRSIEFTGLQNVNNISVTNDESINGHTFTNVRENVTCHGRSTGIGRSSSDSFNSQVSDISTELKTEGSTVSSFSEWENGVIRVDIDAGPFPAECSGRPRRTLVNQTPVILV